MRLLVIIIVFFSGLCVFEYIEQTCELEFIMYDLYVSKFEGLYTVDKNYDLKIDRNKLSEFMMDKGYKIVYIDDSNAHFYVECRNLLSKSREYFFYMEKNYVNE